MLNRPAYFKLSEDTKYIALGHSHPETAFNDSLISNFANFAYSAESYFYTYFKTKKLLLNNRQIKAVFIEFTNNQILKEWDNRWTWDYVNLQDLFPKYLPYMNPSDLKILVYGNYMGVISNLPKTAINNLIEIGTATFTTRDITKHGRFGGFLYLPYARVDSLIAIQQNTELKGEPELAKTNIEYLRRIINLCRQKNVQVFLTRSPIHSEWPELKLEARFKEILNSQFYDVEYLDFKDFPFHNKEYGDLSHLNGKGATRFSTFFNSLLKEGLLTQQNKQSFINSKIDDFLNHENSTPHLASTIIQQ